MPSAICASRSTPKWRRSSTGSQNRAACRRSTRGWPRSFPTTRRRSWGSWPRSPSARSSPRRASRTSWPAASAALGATHGRDPDELLDQYRRKRKEGGDPYWAAGSALKLDDLKPGARRIEALLFGDCDLQMEADFLRREAARRGIDLRIAATFPDDVRLAAEHEHDAIFIGALRARHLSGPAARGRRARLCALPRRRRS